MGQILLFIITLVIIIVGFALVVSRKEAGKHGTSAKALLRVKLRTGAEEFVGICKSAVETASQKEARKQKALAMIQERGVLSNAEIREALGVSSRTAVRYLDELEREGKVEQVGKVGHAVTYRVKSPR